MEKRGVVNSNTPSVTDTMAKRAGASTPAAKVAELDDDTTRRLSQAAATELKKRRE